MKDDAPTLYIYLDDDRDRRKFIQQLAATRYEMRRITRIVPENQWYAPRYDGLSLAGTLGHLNFSDNMALLLLNMALVGLRPAPSSKALARVKGLTRRLFQKRLIASSLDSMDRNQERIITFVDNLPVDRFSRSVWNPARQQMTTVERGLQEMLLHHWQHHLAQIIAAEGIAPSQT